MSESEIDIESHNTIAKLHWHLAEMQVWKDNWKCFATTMLLTNIVLLILLWLFIFEVL